MSKRSNQKQQRIQKEKKEKEILRRFYNRNYTAMLFCNKHGLVIYPSNQAGTNNVKIFVLNNYPYTNNIIIFFDCNMNINHVINVYYFF